MGGKRVENYWTAEMKSMLEEYHNFEILIPAQNRSGAAHSGEEGRYIESLLKEKISKFLPKGLEILSGFILRAGVKCQSSGNDRKNDKDKHSSQLDMIVYDSENYPVYQRFGDSAVVLPEGVIGIISVKKNLYKSQLRHEFEMIQYASELCGFSGKKGPFLALVGMDDVINSDIEKCAKLIFDEIENVVKKQNPVCYHSMPGFVGNLQKWTIHKAHRKDIKCAEYQLFIHEEGEEHLGLQYIIKGILDVYYDETRSILKQPGYISFPKNKSYHAEVRRIEYMKK